MNTSLVTTGLIPLCVGSQELFQLQATLDGLPWSLVGGSVTLNLKDPTGSVTAITATISGGTVTAGWTVTSVTGTWTRSWTAVDSTGLTQVSRPLQFVVISSP
jgi:hypothetical protein